MIGILFAYVINWELTCLGKGNWRWMLGSAAVPAIAFLVGVLVIPESPRWLLTHQRGDEGRAVLAKILSKAEIDHETYIIKKTHEDGDGTWKDVFSRPMRRRLFIGVTLAFLCQVTGINAVLYYGGILFQEHMHGLSSKAALMANVFIGIVNLVGTIAAMILLDRWGRRPMLLTASLGMFISLSVLVFTCGHANTPAAVMLGAVLAYVGSFAFAMGPVPWVIISEIFPRKIRGRAAAFATSILWSGCLLVTLTFLSLIRTLGIAGTFAIFSSLSLLSFFFVIIAVPETRNKTLEELQDQFADNS